MASFSYWARFPRVNEGKAETQSPNPDYWGQFPKAEATTEATGTVRTEIPVIGLEGQQSTLDQVLNPGQDQAQGQGQYQGQPQDQAQDPSFLDNTKRLGGVAAHGFAQGVGGLADLANLATRGMEGGFELEKDHNSQKEDLPAYNLNAYQPEQVSAILGNKVNELFGTTLEPKDAFEKFVHLMGEFSVPLGVGGKAASIGGQLLKVGKHEALAAGAAAGITAAEEAGVDSELGKVASGIGGTAVVSALGSISPKGLALTLAGFGKNRLNIKALEAAQRIGVDLPGVAATDAVAPAAAHNLISRVPYFGDKIRDTLSKTGEHYQRSFESLLDTVSPPLTEDLSQVAQRIYAPLENVLPATDTIDPTPWLKEIKRIETKMQSVAKSDPTKKLLGVFREIKQNLEGKTQEALPDYLSTASETVKKSLEKQLQEGHSPLKTIPVKTVPVQEVVRQKIEFNKMMKDKNLFDRADSDSLSYLHKLQAVTKDMLEQYGTKHNPEFLKALKKADLEYGAYAKRENLEGFLADKLSSLVTEEPQYTPLIKALQKKDNQKFLKNNLGEDNYQKLGDYVDVAKAMESIKRNNQNPSGSGWVGALASIAGGLYAAPAYTIGLLAATQAGTKLLTDKRFINLAHRYAKQPTESMAQKLETIIKETTGKSSNILNQELGEIQKSQEETGIRP